VILYLGGAMVMIAVIGAIYLEILVQSRSVREVWMVTQDVAAGTRFTTDDVRQVTVPETGDHILYYRGNPIASGRRAGHSLSAGHVLADDDLLQRNMVLVPVNFKSAPPLSHGDVIDVYTLLGTKTIQVGKGLPVESATTIWVPAVDEPDWITLQANNAPLYAATSSGIGVPAVSGLGIQDAVASLAGSLGGQSALTPPPLVPSSPPPLVPGSPTPRASPTPAPSPTR